VKRGRIAFAVLLPLVFLAQGWKHPPRFPREPEWAGIARLAGAHSAPGELVLAPPDLDGFGYYSERPVVASFGLLAHHEVGEWRRRLLDLTGRPDLLAADFPGGTGERVVAIGAAYDSLVFRSPDLPRRYRAGLLVARRGLGPAPAWAESLDESGKFALYRVRLGP
jgi:hypothetical protein